jgi:Glycosyltransferase sugar-binding region containing DXD motif
MTLGGLGEGMGRRDFTKRPETLRAFWHGDALGPYNLLGPRSFVDCGHRIELFTYDPKIVVPDWIVRRDANEIWETAHVMSYEKGLWRGSFALHSNLFRYAMLHELGGWWIDLDVVLLRPELPTDEIYFSLESSDPPRATTAVIKFPPGHPALAEAVKRCVALGEASLYGEPGADLFTEMVVTHDLARLGHALKDAYPIPAIDIKALFDPDQYEEVQKRCTSSHFIHLFNETWRRAGIPRYLGPPENSFIDRLLLKHGFKVPGPRMEFADLERWTAYLTLHEEFQTAPRSYRLSNEALRNQLRQVEAAKGPRGSQN